METQVRDQLQQDEPHFLLNWDSGDTRQRTLQAGGLSLIVHIIFGIVLLYIASLPPAPREVANIQLDARRVTPLIAPPPLLTQRAPNSGKLSKEFNLDSLRATESAPRVPAPGSADRRAQVRKFQTPNPGVGSTPTPVVPDAPALDPSKLRASTGPIPTPLGAPNIPQPKIVPEEKPKLAFETPGSETGTAGSKGLGRIPVPDTSVHEAIRGAVRHGSQGMVVGDEDDATISLPSPKALGAPSSIGSKVQLLSDPMGVDFSPYLIKVLTAVRKNWFAVIPESARLGRGGVVAIQFAINRDGSVPKLVISMPSGADALDRAAVAGISASNPFPPLPNDFRGPQVRLQLTFKYKTNDR